MIQLIVAFLIFAFFAISGLIVDVGFARLTQRQMAVATDAASIEGMRLQDSADEQSRRLAARDMLRDHFDDDFHATQADARHYGAGPVISLAGGTTSLSANQQVVVDAQDPMYEPDPQLNLANARHGDMVSGTFDPEDGLHLENGAYARTDFAPAGVPSGLEAFLVRLRRTTNAQGLDTVAGVSSSGPTLPYLFSRGSLIAGETRDRGIAVRSTSIAAGRRTTLVGLPNLAAGLTGSAPFLLDLQYWNGLASAQTTTLRFGHDGTMNGGTGGGANPPGGPPMPNPNRPPSGPPGGPPIIPPGQITGGGGEPRGVIANRLGETRRAWSIGDPVEPLATVDVGAVFAWLGRPDRAGYQARVFYLPIYDGVMDWDGRPGNSNPPFLPPVDNQPKDDQARIVGFGAVLVVSAQWPTSGSGNGTDTPAEIRIRKLSSFVAPTNASAVETPGLTGTFADAILARGRAVDSPLRAAALVR